MLYSTMREQANTGDLVLVEGRGLVSLIIRAFSADKFSHVGVLCWVDEAKTCLMIIEMREFKGWQMSRASDWLEDAGSASVFFVKAPDEINNDTGSIKDYLFTRRGLKYDYWALPKIWWSQIRNKGFRKAMNDRTGEVCSTFAASAWVSGGWNKPSKDFKPGAFLEYAKWTSIIVPDPVLEIEELVIDDNS